MKRGLVLFVACALIISLSVFALAAKPGTECGNGVCESGENPGKCPADCSNSDGGSDGGSDGVSGTTGTSQCSDGIDNDGDGLYDFEGYCKNKRFCYDADPGCTSFDDDNEFTCVSEIETCDGQDNDCDGLIDEGGICPSIVYYCDADGDGYVDTDATASCSSYDCVPNNCIDVSGDDCNDDSANVNLGIIESCTFDGVDNDCDGIVDECSCNNSVKDGDESDVDCGGSCGGCSVGNSCSIDSDCSLGSCVSGVCTELIGCSELYQGHNDATADRINIVFTGLSYDSMGPFIQDMEQAIDLNGSGSGAVKDTVGFLVSNGAGTDSRINGASGLLNDNNWHHIVATYRGGASDGLNLYLDGNLVGTASTTSLPNLGSNSDSLMVGTSTGLPVDQSLEGSVDDFSIWSRELSYSEISELYSSGSGNVVCSSSIECANTQDLTGYYPFDSSGEDLTGGYNGVLEGNSFISTGKISNSVYMDGNSDYVNLGDRVFDSISEFTVSIWFRVDDLSKDHALLSKGPWGGNDLVLIWRDEEVAGSASGGPGLMSLTAYKDNKDKFNFWYVDQIFTPNGDPSVSCTYCQNSEANSYCGGLPNTYRANFCDLSFRSCAYFGGTSYNSVTNGDWPYTFDHEFQHQFPGLADEYTESGKSDKPRYPNCADDYAAAQTWWSDLVGQIGSDGSAVNYYAGCSYNSENYRSSQDSLLRSRGNYNLGLVNELKVLEALSAFDGTSSGQGTNAMEITIVGEPTNVDSYVVRNIRAVEFSGPVNRLKDRPFNLTVRAGNKLFSQGFDTYDELVIEDFEGEELSGEIIDTPKDEIKVVVPTGNAKYNERRGLIEFPINSKDKSRGRATGFVVSTRESVPIEIEVSTEEGEQVELKMEEKESLFDKILRFIGLKE